MPSSAVLLRLHRTGIQAELTLPIIELKLGWQKPLPDDSAGTVRQYGEELKGYIHEHVHPISPDGRPWTVTVNSVAAVSEASPEGFPDVRVDLTLTPPPGAPVDRLTFQYDVIFHQLITHTAIVSIASDWNNGVLGDKPTILATMRDTNPSIAIDRSQGSWWQGVGATFRLGARHIAEGTDHLLFLLALLLPAPLLIAGSRWGGYAGTRPALGRIIKVVTAFTVGHSITLVLGALGWVHLPSTLIESAIALSIFVSAIHALFPIFRGKEVFIAGGFGLVHGLAFAATLTEFGFDPLTLVSSVLGFNLGIEAFQLLVIGVTMPWLILLARTRLYPSFRIVGAGLTGIAAAAWFFERAFGLANPIGPLVERAATHGIWIIGGLALLSIAVAFGDRLGSKSDLAVAGSHRCESGNGQTRPATAE